MAVIGVRACRGRDCEEGVTAVGGANTRARHRRHEWWLEPITVSKIGSERSASRREERPTPKRLHSSRSGGKRSPGRSTLRWMRSIICAMISSLSEVRATGRRRSDSALEASISRTVSPVTRHIQHTLHQQRIPLKPTVSFAIGLTISYFV